MSRTDRRSEHRDPKCGGRAEASQFSSRIWRQKCPSPSRPQTPRLKRKRCTRRLIPGSSIRGGPALTLLHLDSSLGLGAVCIDTKDTITGHEPLPLSIGPSLLQRPGGSEVPLRHGDFLRGLKEFRELPAGGPIPNKSAMGWTLSFAYHSRKAGLSRWRSPRKVGLMLSLIHI